MEKEILALLKLVEEHDKVFKFMGWMQPDEGLAERRKFAIPAKTIGTVTPDKRSVMFKVFVTDKSDMMDFVSSKNPDMKPKYEQQRNLDLDISGLWLS